MVAVAPDKFRRGWPGGTASDYERVLLEVALAAVYLTDAHLVTYVVETEATHQPRLRKDSLEDYPLAVYVGVLFADVDNAGHREWRPGERPSVPEGAGVYLTRAGYRLVQPLAKRVAPAMAERMLATWIAELRAAGIAVDERCRDWTRHFRCPHVLRDRKPYTSPLVDLSRMREREFEPVPDGPPPDGSALAA